MTVLQSFEKAVLNEVCPAGEAWMCEVQKGQYFRIIDLEETKQSILYLSSAENPTERYSAMDTLAINQQIYFRKRAPNSTVIWAVQ